MVLIPLLAGESRLPIVTVTVIGLAGVVDTGVVEDETAVVAAATTVGVEFKVEVVGAAVETGVVLDTMVNLPLGRVISCWSVNNKKS